MTPWQSACAAANAAMLATRGEDVTYTRAAAPNVPFTVKAIRLETQPGESRQPGHFAAVQVMRSSFSTDPVENDLVTLDGIVFRVRTATPDNFGRFLLELHEKRT